MRPLASLLVASSCCAAIACGGASSTTDPAGTAGAAGVGSGGAAGGPAVGPIDPIVVGHAWTYDVTELGTFPACPSGEHTGQVLSQGPKDGEADALAVQSLCEKAGVVYYTVSGDLVRQSVNGVWRVVLDAPVEEGHTWTEAGITYVWRDVGDVTVPAGTFPHCFKLTAKLGASYTTFCRGVGPVHWYSVDAAGNGYEAVLKAKNF